MTSLNPRNLQFDDHEQQQVGDPRPQQLPEHDPRLYLPDEPAHFAPDAPPLHGGGREDEYDYDVDRELYGPADVYDPVWTGQGEVEGPSEAVAQVDLERIEQILASEHFRPRRRRQDFVPPPPPAARKRSHGLVWAAGTFVLLVAASAFIAYQTTERVSLLDGASDAGGVMSRAASLLGMQQEPRGEMKEMRAPVIAAQQPAAAPAPKTHLVVTGASADNPEQILVGVSAEGVTGDMNAVVAGLVPGTTLSRGKAWGATGWILPAAELSVTYLRPPSGFSGVMEYSVSLQRPDNSVIDRQTMRLEWTAPNAQQPAPQQQTEARDISPEEVGAMLKRGEELLMEGDIASARLLLQRAADAQDARAAFALAATYDPIELRRLRVLGAAPDVALARDWYEKAKQYGSREAPKRLELLASQFR